MTLVMAEKDQPVFRDFLGIGHKDEVKQTHFLPAEALRQQSGTFEDEEETELPTVASSANSGGFETYSAPGNLTSAFALAFPSSSDPSAESWLRSKSGVLLHHGVKSAFYKPELEDMSGKKREHPIGRGSLQERLQMSVEALECTRPQKLARQELKDDRKINFKDAPSVDELCLSMHPPRPCSKALTMLQTSTCKPDFSPQMAKRPERAKPVTLNTGLSSPTCVSYQGVSTDRASVPASRDNTPINPSIGPPAADEGSQTGRKGSVLAGLMTNGPASPAAGPSSGPNVTPRRPKVSSYSAGADPLLGSRHQLATTPSRQLTIFYGGQAHVFDDVPPDKANQIMILAGANGRSWSTTYSTKQTSASDGSLSVVEREREKPLNLSRVSSVSGGNLALSSEVQTLLRGLAQSGVGPGNSGLTLPLTEASAGPLSVEIQATQDWVAANGCKRENVHGRTLARPTPCTDGSGNEALLRSQHWI